MSSHGKKSLNIFVFSMFGPGKGSPYHTKKSPKKVHSHKPNPPPSRGLPPPPSQQNKIGPCQSLEEEEECRRDSYTKTLFSDVLPAVEAEINVM